MRVFLKWRSEEGSVEIQNTDPDEIQNAIHEETPPRTIEEVEMEIKILRKWGKDVPKELLKEYKSLTTR